MRPVVEDGEEKAPPPPRDSMQIPVKVSPIPNRKEILSMMFGNKSSLRSN